MESKKQFADWIKHRIKKYELIENVDYVSFSLNGEKGRPQEEYALTVDCAKELSMVEGNAKGKQARQYFIACENKLKESAKPLSTLDLLELTIKGMRENNQEIQEVKQKVLELEARTQTRPEYFTVVGYGTLNGININLTMASRIGQRASRICKQRGIQTDKTPDPRFGEIKMYPKAILEEVFSQSI